MLGGKGAGLGELGFDLPFAVQIDKSPNIVLIGDGRCFCVGGKFQCLRKGGFESVFVLWVDIGVFFVFQGQCQIFGGK